MKTVSFRSVCVAACILGIASVLQAQTSSGSVRIGDDRGGFVYEGFGGYFYPTVPCGGSTAPQYGSVGISCQAILNGSPDGRDGGTAYASAYSNNYQHRQNVVTTLNQSGYYMSGSAEATATLNNSIFVNGASGAGDNLVFRFLSNRSVGFLNYTNGGSQRSSYSLYLGTTGGNAFVQGIDAPGLTSYFNSGNAQYMSNGELDFTVGFDSFSGVFNYGLQSYAQIYQHSDQPIGAYGSSVLDSRLLGIDAVDAQGHVIASASFDYYGNATLDMTVTPEPASLVLVGTGVLGLFGVSRRRRR